MPSPRINFRISEELAARLAKESKKRKISESECARRLLAEALDFSGDTTLQKAGRPKISSKS